MPRTSKAEKYLIFALAYIIVLFIGLTYELTWSWFIIMSPFFILSILNKGLILGSISKIENLAGNHRRLNEIEREKLKDKYRKACILSLILIQIFLLAAYLSYFSSSSISFGFVLIPTFVSILLNVIYTVKFKNWSSALYLIRRRIRSEESGEEEEILESQENEKWSIAIAENGYYLIWLVMLVGKIDDWFQWSWFIVFLPLFLFLGQYIIFTLFISPCFINSSDNSKLRKQLLRALFHFFILTGPITFSLILLCSHLDQIERIRENYKDTSQRLTITISHIFAPIWVSFFFTFTILISTLTLLLSGVIEITVITPQDEESNNNNNNNNNNISSIANRPHSSWLQSFAATSDDNELVRGLNISSYQLTVFSDIEKFQVMNEDVQEELGVVQAA